MENFKIEREISQSQQEQESMTILQHIECIVELVNGSGLKEEFYKEAYQNINSLCKKMSLTEKQAVLFSVFIENSDSSRIELSQLSSFMGCRHIKTMTLLPDIEELENRKLIRCSKYESGAFYRVPKDVIRAISQNMTYEPKNTKNIGVSELFFHIEQLFKEKSENEISYDNLMSELQVLLDNNASLLFSQQVKKYIKECLANNSLVLLLLMCHHFINLSDENVGIYDIERTFGDNWEYRQLKTILRYQVHDLQKIGVIENCIDNGFIDSDNFKITEKAKKQLFAELDIKINKVINKENLIDVTTIPTKSLFYNNPEQKQIDQLTNLLKEENYKNIQKRLSECSMRKGFACLFYGVPGTGKTETAYQIARCTNRDIFMVNASQIKSKWVGDSEKNIKALFDEYRSTVLKSQIAPILLFNEADAILGNRIQNIGHSVDKMENTIQNIILQEMENLDGIMIATTNLTQNLDSAFERRFIYKIEFQKPSLDARILIWKSFLPSLKTSVMNDLAKTYNFSGGQIENIARKHSIEYILSGKEPTEEILHEFCRNENLNLNNKCQKVGFF